MKKTILILSFVLTGTGVFAQTDSIKVEKSNDTIHIGGMIILKKGEANEKKHVTVTVSNHKYRKMSNVSTSYMIFDIGFANWEDKTDYAQATSNGYIINSPVSHDITANDLKLKTGKSVNVNIWFFMQRLNLIKHYVNLKYGLGLELNNYRFTSNISLNNGGNNPYNPSEYISHPFIFRDSINFYKNKLAADYITVPLMLNFCTNPHDNRRGFSLSAGVSMGYLYSSRNKQISSERGKQKIHGDFDIENWKFAYIGEMGLGPVRLYGSYSPKSLFENDLNFRPYNVGIRISNW